MTYMTGMEFAAAVARGQFDIPHAEFPARRADMEARGMTTWIIGREQFGEFARTDGFSGWLERNDYDRATAEWWFPVEMVRDCQMLLGAYRSGGES